METLTQTTKTNLLGLNRKGMEDFFVSALNKS
jgi:hypothetical protein